MVGRRSWWKSFHCLFWKRHWTLIDGCNVFRANKRRISTSASPPHTSKFKNVKLERFIQIESYMVAIEDSINMTVVMITTDFHWLILNSKIFSLYTFTPYAGPRFAFQPTMTINRFAKLKCKIVNFKRELNRTSLNNLIFLNEKQRSCNVYC